MASTTKTWVNNNPPTVEDDDLNGFKTENNNLIVGAGLALDTGDLQQTNKAVAHYAAAGQIYVDSGAANAYVLSAGNSRADIPAYVDRAKFLFVPDNPNTGASTVNIGGLGVKDLMDENGVALTANRLTNREISIEYILASDEFRLANVIDALAGGGETVISGSATSSIVVSGLDGAYIGGYMVEGVIICTGSSILSIELNGDSTASNYPAAMFRITSVVTVTSVDAEVGRTAVGNFPFSIRIIQNSLTSETYIQAEFNRLIATEIIKSQARYTVTDNITSIGLTNASVDMGVNSTMRVRRLV